MSTTRLLGLLCVCVLVSAMPPVAHADPHPKVLRLGTGGIGGTYFPLGSLLAQAISAPRQPGQRDVDSYIADTLIVPQISNGSIANVRDVRRGVLDGALIQADVAHWFIRPCSTCSGG